MDGPAYHYVCSGTVCVFLNFRFYCEFSLQSLFFFSSSIHFLVGDAKTEKWQGGQGQGKRS